MGTFSNMPTHSITTRWSDQLLMPWSHQTFRPVPTVKLLGIMFRIDVGPPLFTLLQPEMPTDGARSCRCDQPLSPHLRFCVPLWHGILAKKSTERRLLGEGVCFGAVHKKYSKCSVNAYLNYYTNPSHTWYGLNGWPAVTLNNNNGTNVRTRLCVMVQVILYDHQLCQEYHNQAFRIQLD